MTNKPFVPAHKNVIDPPGQIVNPVTLGDYVNSKYGFDLHPYLKTPNVEPPKKKLSFDEWWTQGRVYDKPEPGTKPNSPKWWARVAWNAAQENK